MTCLKPQSRAGAELFARRFQRLVFLLAFTIHAQPAAAVPDGPEWAGPSALAAARDGTRLFVACGKSKELATFRIGSHAITSDSARIRLNWSPSGIAVSRDGRTLYVTCAAPESTLAIIDAVSGKSSGSIALGHTALAPVLSPDGKTVYACNRFSAAVSVVDLGLRREVARIAVDREPVAAALTADGKRLLVANHLHAGRSDGTNVAARVSVIDTIARKVLKTVKLPNGSGLLRDIRISPDGRYACVTHLLARYHLPTTQIERGWMNSNALTLIDLETLEVFNTVLLDNVESGAANPWTCGWSPDGQVLFVTHAGTHEASLIRYPALVAKLGALPDETGLNPAFGYTAGPRTRAEVPADFSFLTGLRQRVPLRGKGPRAAVMVGSSLFVAGYFSDSIELIDLANADRPAGEVVRLSADRPMSVPRQGEHFFNDGSICLQGWQSCASCHSEDGRVDALNWDLLNDGIGNPKNSRSLLLSHATPPAMSMGVRESAEMAVRAGIRNILFTRPPEEVALAMDEWLKTMKPIASPFLVRGKPTAAAGRGAKIFHRRDTGCARCHAGPLFTNQQEYDVGTASGAEKPGTLFDTPTLLELWRTAPYLYDGSAATLREVLVDRNRADTHGHTSHLKGGEVDDLIAFLLSI